MVESGADGITIHKTINVLETKKVLASRCATVGNLDPGALTRLAPDEIPTLSRGCMDKGIDVLAPACGLDIVTPLNNLKAMTEATRRYERSGGG